MNLQDKLKLALLAQTWIDDQEAHGVHGDKMYSPYACSAMFQCAIELRRMIGAEPHRVGEITLKSDEARASQIEES